MLVASSQVGAQCFCKLRIKCNAPWTVFSGALYIYIHSRFERSLPEHFMVIQSHNVLGRSGSIS